MVYKLLKKRFQKLLLKLWRHIKITHGYLGVLLSNSAITDADLLNALDGFIDLDNFIDHIRNRQKPTLGIASKHRQHFILSLLAEYPDAKNLTVSAADKVCEHIFDLLGSGPTYLGNPIDWHLDFKTGHQFNPHKYYKFVLPAKYPGGYDIKVPWELSRCQHFSWLGQAYWFTDDEKYACEFVTQVEDWIEGNPWPWGVNWACTMDVAIRAVNWLWGYHFFKYSPSLNDDFILKFFKSLLVHGRHISDNLAWSEINTNHYLSHIVGLVYLGILCPEFKEAQRWRKVGLGALWHEVMAQTFNDGVDFEAAISYHRLVTELCLSAIVLCQRNGIVVPEEVLKRLENMLEFIMHYMKPDDTAPIVGDMDNGRIHRLKAWVNPSREWLDHRYLLAIGAVLFDREDFAHAAGDQWEEAFWLLGQKAIDYKLKSNHQSTRSQKLESRVFPDGKLCIMRHQHHYLILDAGDNGQRGKGDHGHNDALSIELSAFGTTFIIDPGTFVYTQDYNARHQFRSTAYHNTVLVDGKEQNRCRPDQPFSMADDAKPEIVKWESRENYDVIWAKHSGYTRLKVPVVHHRRILFDKEIGMWLIVDYLEGTGVHNIQQYWHFTPIDIARVDYPPLSLRADDQGVSLYLAPLDELNRSLKIKDSWISRSYGKRLQAPVAVYLLEGIQLPITLRTLLYPATVDTNLSVELLIDMVHEQNLMGYLI